MEKKLLAGENFEFLNDEGDSMQVWFSPITSCFCLMLNGKVIKSTKTFKPVKMKLDDLGAMECFSMGNNLRI
jgi:hypothetical protein